MKANQQARSIHRKMPGAAASPLPTKSTAKREILIHHNEAGLVTREEFYRGVFGWFRTMH
jgi:hypothetical protein